MSDTFDAERVAWVLDGRDLGRLLAAIEAADEVVMDLETTGLDEHAVLDGATNGGYPARIVLASLTLPIGLGEPTTWAVPLSHPDSPWSGQWVKVMTRIAGALLTYQKALLNQNVKFDCRWVYAHTGVDLSPLIAWDTQMSSHLLDETESTHLKDRAPATFHVKRWDDFDLTTPGAAEAVPLIDLGLYAARDTYWTWRLAVLHRAAMLDQGPDPDDVESARLGRLAAWCAMPTTSTLTAIEQRGMVLDVPTTRLRLGEELSEARDLGETLADRYGMDHDGMSYAGTSSWFREWTERAVDAGDLRVTATTERGAASWGKAVLARQAYSGSLVAEALLHQRQHTKRAEYLTSWLHWATPDGLVYANYNAGRVVTGRLSSDSPNMQQVTASLKPCWVPSPGHLFADLDYSQVEMRVAAFISRCEPMMAAFARGDDLHRLLAARITDKDPDDVDAAERQKGKSANFGLLYLMSPVGFREYALTAYGVALTDDEALAVHETYFETWTGLRDWHTRTIFRAQRDGQIVSPIGRVRRVPGIWDASDRLRGFAERQAINSPVQGFASDLMQIAAASIEGRLPGHAAVPGARLVGTVHDDIVVEVPIETWKETALACRDRMLSVDAVLAKMDCAFDVPLEAAIKVGTRWGLGDVAELF